MTALVEYLIRLRIEEPTGTLSPGQVGDAMHALLGELEVVCLEQEIISRTVPAGPDAPGRIRCAARGLDPTRHYATSARWTITTPTDQTIVTCCAACALDWLVKALPAALTAVVANNAGTAENAA